MGQPAYARKNPGYLNLVALYGAARHQCCSGEPALIRRPCAARSSWFNSMVRGVDLRSCGIVVTLMHIVEELIGKLLTILTCSDDLPS